MPADQESQQLALRAHISSGTVTIGVSGELDVVSVPALQALLVDVLGRKPQRLILDMTQARYVDCAAARMIIRAGRSLPGGIRVMIRPGSVVHRLMDLTGLSADCETVARPPRSQHGCLHAAGLASLLRQRRRAALPVPGCPSGRR